MYEAADGEPPRVVDEVAQLDFALDALAPRPPEVRVLMADPAYFDVTYVINPHMEGQVGNVDVGRARRQWESVRAAYRELGYPVEVVAAEPGLPDLVFMANQSFPGQLPDGRWVAIMSKMHAPQRRAEVAVAARWYAARGALTLRLRDVDLPFEGMGDATWVPQRRCIVGGYGFRSDRRAYDELAERFQVPVIALRLVSEHFYHLDTCLQLIDEHTAMYVPEAFDDRGILLLKASFPRLIELPSAEAREGLSCNGHSPDGRHFIVHHGSKRTTAAARDLGLEVIEVDTSEFLKSGGSVYCMKLMIP